MTCSRTPLRAASSVRSSVRMSWQSTFAELSCKERSQRRVEFDSDELFGAGREQAGKDSSACANFEHRGLAQIAQSVYDRARRGRADEKILTQLRLMTPCIAGAVSHR